jgi:acetylornithine deacetylase
VSAAAAYVAKHRERLLTLIEDLVRIPSVNQSPSGDEAKVQEFIARTLCESGYEPDVYALSSIDELKSHPLATTPREYGARSNVAAVRKGGGGAGRSLLLSGHVDTVPPGTLPWTRPPFEPQREGNRLYGRGSNDMKAGIAINLFVMEALSAMDVALCGDVIFESVVDEEFGGVNGTLAGRLRGYTADAAVITEPSGLRICAAQRGGRTAHLFFTASGGVLGKDLSTGAVVEQLSYFLQKLPEFAAQRRFGCKGHAMYTHCDEPVPVTVTKLTTGPWGTSEPITVPEEGRVELYWQLMPGETQQEVEIEFFAWLDAMVAGSAGLIPERPRVVFPVRWLPGSAIDAESDVCAGLQRASEREQNRTPQIEGIEGPCDMFVFHEFGIPAVLWGPGGGQTHGSDEWVDIDSVVEAATVLLRFVSDWCGTTAT